MRDSASQTQEVVFDFGTSPHGLSAEPRQTVEEAHQADGRDSLADGVERAAQDAPRSCAAGQPLPFHYLELDDCELLHVVWAVEHSRNQTRKAIQKGLAVPEDMEGTNSLWQKLQEVMALRMRKEYGGWL
jgi:hypothetical protein